jgi:hypothetical protein
MYLRSLRSLKLIKQFLIGNGISHLLAFAFESCDQSYVSRKMETASNRGKMEGRIEVMGRRERRCRQLLNGLNEKRRHCKLKEEALDRTVW